ncbi:MAG: hypothetical protein ABSA69_08205 [Verrucomicrobiota bacterium]
MAAQHNFDGVIETRTQEQIESGKASDTDIVANTIGQPSGPSQNQFPGNAAVIERLTFDLDNEIVAGSVLTGRDVLPEIDEPLRERFRILM